MNSTPGISFVDKRTLSRDEIIAHIWDRLLAARDDVVGIILFGSFARGEAWHDIDVLVVLRERIPTRKALKIARDFVAWWFALDEGD